MNLLVNLYEEKVRKAFLKLNSNWISDADNSNLFITYFYINITTSPSFKPQNQFEKAIKIVREILFKDLKDLNARIKLVSLILSQDNLGSYSFQKILHKNLRKKNKISLQYIQL